MSEYVSSPDLPRLYCPGCEPEADPTTEILDVHYCDTHMPSRVGVDDTRDDVYLSGSAECGGEGNRRWCEFIHRPDKGKTR